MELGKEQILSKFARHASDTGSSEVQIAALSERILKLTEHFQVFKKDFHSKTGLMKMVSRRRRLLKYLKNTDNERYKTIINQLGLRK